MYQHAKYLHLEIAELWMVSHQGIFSDQVWCKAKLIDINIVHFVLAQQFSNFSISKNTPSLLVLFLIRFFTQKKTRGGSPLLFKLIMSLIIFLLYNNFCLMFIICIIMHIEIFYNVLMYIMSRNDKNTPTTSQQVMGCWTIL